MKKVLAVLTVVAVLSLAGSAMAYEGRHHGRGPGSGQNWQQGGGPCWQGDGHRWHRGPGPRDGGFDRMGPGAHRNWNADVPENIRNKMVEAEKLMIDLRDEMSKPQIDKARALEVWKQHRALRNDISEWFFTQRLEQATNRPATPVQPPQNP